MYLQTAVNIDETLNYGLIPAIDLLDDAMDELTEEADAKVVRRLTLAMGILRRVEEKFQEIDAKQRGKLQHNEKNQSVTD